MACMSLNGNVNVVMAYNEGKSNEILTNGQYGLTDIKTAQVDGQVYCSFTRQSVTEIKNIVFNLADDRFHLMLARGPASQGK
ncbi:hypothetical protein SK128_007797 [Halocaridina rubra]|uniref:DOMON domain-containing protein n=1 Tax=Halocaridina rubra TaxID=373956 RepID=A0AAN9AAI9_HALRR